MLSNDQIDFYRSQASLAKKQIELLEKQKEFLDLQKKDLAESKKNRESIKQFTFILAFGVVVTIFFNLFQITVEFEQAKSIHSLFISAIFIFLFLFYIGFIFHIFSMKREMYSYWKKNWPTILGLLIMVAIIGWLLLTIPNLPINLIKPTS